MPAYNAERFIAASIRSVLRQTYTDWELIVVDDGSTDETAEIVHRFCQEDPRIKYFSQPNGGQSNARNAGIRQAQGRLIGFLDSDDLWDDEKLELQVARIEQEAADLVFSGGFIFHDDNVADESVTFPVVCGRFDGARMFEILYARNRISTLSVLVGKSALERVGCFDEAFKNVCEDYDLWLRLARTGAVFYGMEDKLVRYRRHPASTTHVDSRLLGPMIQVVKTHSDYPVLSPNQVKTRIRGLYRELVTALLREGDIAGARLAMREFTEWDPSGLITRCQNILLWITPSKFEIMSRECLYRAEWHVARVINKLT